jgi:hypothetical protein
MQFEGEDWKLGDAVKDKLSNTMWKVVELGVGDCDCFLKLNGEVEFHNQGDARAKIQFVEPAKKVKKGKKWVVVEGKKESFCIDKGAEEYENDSCRVRIAGAARESEESNFDRQLADHDALVERNGGDEMSSIDGSEVNCMDQSNDFFDEEEASNANQLNDSTGMATLRGELPAGNEVHNSQ